MSISKILFFLSLFLFGGIIYRSVENWGGDYVSQLVANNEDPKFIHKNFADEIIADTFDESLLDESVQIIDSSFWISNDQYHLECYQIWKYDTTDLDYDVINNTDPGKYWLVNGLDTLVFSNKFIIHLYQNAKLIVSKEFDKSLYQADLAKDEYNSYRINRLGKIIINTALGHIYFEQNLEIPMTEYQINGVFGIDLFGNILFSRLSGVCQDGIQLSQDKTRLLTCKDYIDLTTNRVVELSQKGLALAAFWNDSTICVINDNRTSDQITNAAIISVTKQGKDTVFNFLYENIEFDTTYKVSHCFSADKSKFLIFGSYVGEVIVFNIHDIQKPQYYIISELVNFRKPRQNIETFEINNSIGKTVFYMDSLGKITGFHKPENLL